MSKRPNSALGAQASLPALPPSVSWNGKQAGMPALPEALRNRILLNVDFITHIIRPPNVADIS